jgi:hypothetical protein
VCVWQPSQDAAHRIDDSLRFKFCCRHLVEEGEKGVIVVLSMSVTSTTCAVSPSQSPNPLPR